MKRFYILMGVAGMFLLSEIALAQQQPPGQTPNPAFQAPSRDVERMNIDFDGGPPEFLLEVMKEASGAPPNVIIHPEAVKVKLPAFKLRGVTAPQIFMALNTLSEPNYLTGFWQPAPSPDGEIWTLSMQRTTSAAIDPRSGLPVGQMVIPKNCRVFNLTMVLSDYTVDDVITAMQGAWDLLNPADSPTVKFHKETRLLILVGNEQQIGVANELVRELTTNVIQKKREAQTQQERADKEKAEPKKS